MKNNKQKDLESNTDKDFIDEYELYYGKGVIQDKIECEEIVRGPLSRRPSFISSYPAILVSIVIIFFSRILTNSSYSDLIWSSHDTVYIKHEFWRLITAIFTHADSVHLISNLPLLILFGWFLFEYFGFYMFPVMSLLIGILTNMVTLYFYADSTRLLGASGMIYGMVALWLVLYIHRDTDHSLMMRLFRATGFALIMLFPETYNPSTSYLAHASGFVIGIITGLFVLPFTRVRTV